MFKDPRRQFDGRAEVRIGDVQPYPDDPPTAVLCVSGGGSRALTAALGQFSALAQLPDPHGERSSMLARFDHLSSVSGGTWASVLFTYAPETISDEQLLISPVDPGDLHLGGETKRSGNVEWIDPHSIGTAPQRFSLESISGALWTMFKWGLFTKPERWRWFWIIGIGELILRPFGLYEAKYKRRVPFPLPRRFFAPSDSWIAENITPENPTLVPDDFHTMRADRAPLIVNMNIIENKEVANAVQIPVQVTAEWGGAPGNSVDGVVGGGVVESFAFTSSLRGGSGDEAEVHFDRRYGLSDISACSSAFFAAFILQRLDEGLDDLRVEVQKVVSRIWIPRFITRWLVNRLFKGLTKLLNAEAADLIPVYNYWRPDALAEGSAANAERGFSDGGDFDNSGILGALARTGATRLVSVINSEQPLYQHPKSDEVIVPGSIALLFGYQGSVDDAGRWVSWGGMRPKDPLSYVQVFDDSKQEFHAIREALFEATKDASGTPWQRTAWTLATLTTVENPVAGVRAGREVEVFFLVNNRVDAWQDAITDDGLREALAEGQRGQSPTAEQPEGDGSGPMEHFPWYPTAGRIELDPMAVNMLAQLAAWNIEQLRDELADFLSPAE
ncbi:MAG: hypothetical protein AAF567_02800 [Actinomycetota bacterium]